MYLLLCLFSSAMAVLALSSWAAKQGSGFAVDELTGQLTGIGDYRRAVVQAGAAAIGILVAILLSNIDYRSLVNVWPVHVVLTWGLVLPTLVIRNVTLGPLTIGYNAGDTDNYSWYKLGGFTFQPTELAKISFILTFAMHLNNVRSRLNEPKELGKLLLHLFVPIGIIHIQGDDGTAIIYGIIGCCMLFAAGLSWKYIIGAFAALAAAAAAAFAFFSDKIGKGYQWYRILAVIDQIRGLIPWPCAAASILGANTKIFRAVPLGETKDAPGTLRAMKRGIEAACGDGKSILITELQPDGGKRMAANAFLNGKRIAAGTVLDA